MSKSEKLQAMEDLNEAIETVVPDLTAVSSEYLLGVAETNWAFSQDIQHEWVRRKMLEEAEAFS